MKFEAEGQEFAKFLRSQEQFIQTVKGQTIFGKRMLFKYFTGGFSYLINQNNWNSNWNKILGFRNMQEKLKKKYYHEDVKHHIY